MKTFSISIPYYASVVLQVEAKTKKEAVQKAFDKAYPSVCCYCSKNIEINEWTGDPPDVEEVLE